MHKTMNLFLFDIYEEVGYNRSCLLRERQKYLQRAKTDNRSMEGVGL